jgi:hypothetical protein
MKNGILVSFLALGLTACGSESDTENPNIQTEFSAGIKGSQEQPILSNADILEGDSATLNTNYTGNILEDSSVDFSFTLAENKKVALALSSGLGDLDLYVDGHDIDLESAFDGSNELIIFDAQAGEHYSVRVKSWLGSGEFQLLLVEANRSSLGLENNEYLVSLDSINTQKCIIDGTRETEESYEDSSFGIINWSAGYIDDLSGVDRNLFSSVDGNSFTVTDNVSEAGKNYSISGQASLTLTTDFTSGAITGSSDGSFEYSEDGEDGSCTATGILTGQVIL